MQSYRTVFYGREDDFITRRPLAFGAVVASIASATIAVSKDCTLARRLRAPASLLAMVCRLFVHLKIGHILCLKSNCLKYQ